MADILEDDTCKLTFFNWKIWKPIYILLKYVPMGSIDNRPMLAMIVSTYLSRVLWETSTWNNVDYVL